MTKPKPRKVSAAETSSSKITAAALIAAATAETVRHSKRIDPRWNESHLSFELDQPFAVYDVEVRDLRPVPPVMLASEGRLRARVWELDPDLRRGAEPIFRRALQGVIDIAGRGMRRIGWDLVVSEVAGSHHAGATWARADETVTLQLLVNGDMPKALLQSERKELAELEARRRGEEGLPAQLPPGVRVTAVLSAPSAARPAGVHRLGEVLAESLCRHCEQPGQRPPACDGLVLTETDAREIHWASEYPELFFRRENERGMLPEILRNQMQQLRGKVIFTEVFEPRIDHVKVSRGNLLRPDGDWMKMPTHRVDLVNLGIPELEPGSARLEFRGRPFGRPNREEPIQIGPGQVLPREELACLMPIPAWRVGAAMESSILRSCLWKMESA